MRYLSESEILPYINAGKKIEQYLGDYYLDNLKCYRYITLGKSKKGYYALIFEKFDDSSEGLSSIYDFSSVEPDDLYGKEIGPFESLNEIFNSIEDLVKLKSDKYLLSGYLDNEI